MPDRTTGFAHGLEKKMRLLKAEGVAFSKGKVNLKESAVGA